MSARPFCTAISRNVRTSFVLSSGLRVTASPFVPAMTTIRVKPPELVSKSPKEFYYSEDNPLTSVKPRLDQEFEVFLLGGPVDLLLRCTVEPCEAWDVNSRREWFRRGRVAVSCHGVYEALGRLGGGCVTGKRVICDFREMAVARVCSNYLQNYATSE